RIFQRRDNDLRRELGFQRYFGPDVSGSKAFGFERPDGSRTYNSAEIAGFLRKLDIMRTVARSVERNRVARLTSLEFVVINDALFARGVPARGALADEQPYLSGEGLVVRLRATEEALYSFLVDMQRPEKDGLRQRYLSVEKFKLEKPDLLNPSDNPIDATITL